jgi:hypothetical protein
MAGAHLQFWLVPDQDPQSISKRIRSWIASMVSDRFDFRVTIQEELNQPPYTTPPDHPAVPILAGAMSAGFGTPAQHMRDGDGARPPCWPTNWNSQSYSPALASPKTGGTTAMKASTSTC